MSDSNRIFRQAALDRLASPERLDQMMQVATPRSGLALVACCALVLLGVAWSIFGSVPEKVSGQGILIQKGGVFVTSARSEGTILALLVGLGDTVRSNQVLAQLSLPELDLRIKHAESVQTNLLGELQRLQEYQQEESRVEAEEQAQQLSAYESMSRELEEQIKALEERVTNYQQLLGRATPGISKVNLLDVQISLSLARADLGRAQIASKQVHLNRMQASERRRQQHAEKENQLVQAQDNLEYLTQVRALNSEVRSLFDGIVIDLLVKEGQLISANTPIATLQRSQERLEARLFLPADAGKKVFQGMPVEVEPVSVKKERHGVMVGRVRDVALFPARPESLLRVLENQTLVAEFSQHGAPIEVVVELTATASGYRWTSGKGPGASITSGTLCEGTITLTNYRPISLALPVFKGGID